MQRITSILLISMLLLSQATIASEAFEFSTVHHSGTGQDYENITSDSQNQTQHDGDHCCHAVAHFLALAQTTSTHSLPVVDDHYLPVFTAFHSQDQIPPRRPPIH